MTKAIKQADQPTHIVVTDFRDINNYNRVFRSGEDVSGLDEARLQELVSKGLVKENKEPKQ